MQVTYDNHHSFTITHANQTYVLSRAEDGSWDLTRNKGPFYGWPSMHWTRVLTDALNVIEKAELFCPPAVTRITRP
jgi:hypothetical protein